MFEPLVSIVIPCYNDARFIEQSVASAIGQTYQHKEVIVVDDGSNEETKAVLKNLAPRVSKLITQENRGQSAARNTGIAATHGTYIVTLDSDDFFEPTFCEKAVKRFQNNSEVKLVTCFANLIFEREINNYVFRPKGGSVLNFLTSNSALGCAMFKKDDWSASEGYDETMKDGFEDWEFNIRLLSNGGIAEVVEEPLYNYRKRSNTTTARANKVKYELLKYIYLKHKDINIAHYEAFILQMLAIIEKEEKEKLKNRERLEFKLGRTILKPFRLIKSIFK